MKATLRVLLAALSLAAAAPAHAGLCTACTNFNICDFMDQGGVSWCMGNGSVCLQGGRCFGGSRHVSDTRARPVVVLMTLHEDDARHRPLIGASGGRRVGGAGEPGSLEDARRVAADALGSPGAGMRVVGGRFLVTSARHALAFRAPGGRAGYTLRAEPEGAGVRVTLKELSGGGPAKLSARETIGDDDALVARLRLDGRPYLVVMRAVALEGEDAEISRRLAALQRPFYDALRALPEPPDAGFDVAESQE